MANIATSGSGMVNPRQTRVQQQKKLKKALPAVQPFSVNDPSTFNQPASTPRPQSRPVQASGVGNAIRKSTPALTPKMGTGAVSAPAPVRPTASSMANNVQGAAFGNAAASAFNKEANALSGNPTIKKGTPAIKPVQPVKRATK